MKMHQDVAARRRPLGRRRVFGPVALLVALLGAAAVRTAAASETGETLAVIVGANVGASDEEPLLYAESDARRLRDVLVSLGGVRPERALLVTGGGMTEVLQAVTEARGRAAEIAGSGRRVTFLFYYSGHGDELSLHLPRGSLPLGRLRQAIAGVPASVRISIFDACRTAARAKGVTRGNSFALAVSPESPQGTAEIFGASLGEPAQESSELGGSVFTHFLLSGLRGEADRDGDAQVTLGELYAYTYRKTVLRTGTGEALQHPTFAVELAGTGEVVLARLQAATAVLEVGRDADRYLVFALPSESVMGELGGDGPGRLALPAGRFLVVRRIGERTGVAQVDLAWGGRRRLTAQDFRPIARTELVARRGRIELRPYRVEPLVGVELSGQPVLPAGRAGLGFAYSRGVLEFQMSLAYVLGQGIIGQAPSQGPNGLVHSVSASPGVAARLFLGRFLVVAAAGLELRYTWQRPYADICPVGACTFGSAGPRFGLRFVLALGRNWTADLSAQAVALFRIDYLTNRFIARPLGVLNVGLGYAF